RLYECDVRLATFLVAVTDICEKASAARLSDELLGQPGLADAGLAGEQGQSAASGVGAIEEATEDGALFLAADERGAVVGRRCYGRVSLAPPGHLEKTPSLWETFEAKTTAVGEVQLRGRTDNDLRCFGDENLLRAGVGHDPGGGVDAGAE